MAPQFPAFDVSNTPQQIGTALSFHDTGASAFTKGKVTVVILLHGQDDEILVRNTFNSNVATELAIEHLPNRCIDLQPFAADEDADVSIKALVEDVTNNMLGPVDVHSIEILHVTGDKSKGKVIAITACRVDALHIPSLMMSAAQWLPEAVLHKLDLPVLTQASDTATMSGILKLLEGWKDKSTSSSPALQDLVDSLPTTSAQDHSANTGPTAGEETETDDDTGYQPDSDSSTDSDDVEYVVDRGTYDSRSRVEAVEDHDPPDLIAGIVFGDDATTADINAHYESLLRQQPPHAGSKRVSNTRVIDDDSRNAKKDKTKRIPRRTFQPDSAVARGSRPARKQQRHPPLMVDPSHHWVSRPRFALPAQKVDGRRFAPSVSKTRMSMATDKAVTQGKIQWEELPRLSAEGRLVRSSNKSAI